MDMHTAPIHVATSSRRGEYAYRLLFVLACSFFLLLCEERSIANATSESLHV
ncbi:hypothetical protein BDN70DRAFT_878759 [Pholiota conissans]|uniref:Uncharacterized protein n=1 Tax=Pholiota conissans TaxID=109636 RepID=A0A9P6D0N6_9AGAR|nr:hypothetical protein BDN70DRAFT_878759 [Pholiota conissans]